MHEKLIRGAAVFGVACMLASVFAFAWRAGVYGCPVAEGCDVPVRTSNHPYTGLGIALLVVGISGARVRHRTTTPRRFARRRFGRALNLVICIRADRLRVYLR